MTCRDNIATFLALLSTLYYGKTPLYILCGEVIFRIMYLRATSSICNCFFVNLLCCAGYHRNYGGTAHAQFAEGLHFSAFHLLLVFLFCIYTSHPLIEAHSYDISPYCYNLPYCSCLLSQTIVFLSTHIIMYVVVTCCIFVCFVYCGAAQNL